MSCCNENDREKPATAGAALEGEPAATGASQEGGGPMAMRMGMAKEMMGQGGGPMAMRRRMMARMGQSEEPSPTQPMREMMDMCAEMLGAMEQTTAMAAFATPELQRMFGVWLKDLETRAAAAVAEGEKDAAALATLLAIDEESACYVLGRLTASGKVTLVARPRT